MDPSKVQIRFPSALDRPTSLDFEESPTLRKNSDIAGLGSNSVSSSLTSMNLDDNKGFEGIWNEAISIAEP